MMYFWPFAWRGRRHTATTTTTSHRDDPYHSLSVPEVTHSHSSETTTEVTTGHDTPTKDADNRTLLTLQVLKAPHTPEGLRPRPAMETLRRELLADTVATTSGNAKVIRRDFLVSKEKEGESSTSRMLPAVPSRSWSMPSQPSILPHSTFPLDAGEILPTSATKLDSPQLEYGKTQTAVGSFVAYFEKTGLFPPASPRAEGYEADADKSHMEETPMKAMKTTSRVIDEWEEKKDDEMQISFHQTSYALLENDTPSQLVKTPVRSVTKQPRRNTIPLSPFSPNISLEASPSSLAKPYTTQQQQPKPAHPYYNMTTTGPVDTSFSSRAALLTHNHGNKTYDFERVIPGLVRNNDEEQQAQEIHVNFPSDQTHVSGMTQSVLLDQDSTFDDRKSAFSSKDNHLTTTANEWRDESLRQQKIQNQRRVKEELLLAIVERLQDEVQLVVDVFKVEQSQASLKVAPKIDQEGILTGLAPEKRVIIVRHLSSMLHELKIAQPEDFILSPTQTQELVQPHNDLQSAIAFCRTLVQMAIPTVDDGKSDGHWSLLPGLRSAMGIDSSPQKSRDRPRGGDTSVFTLPSASADTPMTSNVSLSSTISSSRKSVLRRYEIDGIHVRQAVQIVSTLLHKVSRCCHALLDMEDLKAKKIVRITKDIKTCYQQLLAVDQTLLRSLVDAFELKILPPVFSQLLSNDEEDNNNTELQPLVLPPPRVVRSGRDTTSSLRASPARSCASSSHDLFSPQTADMMSDKYEPTEYDDLRRMNGSVDHDEVEEIRDGPADVERE